MPLILKGVQRWEVCDYIPFRIEMTQHKFPGCIQSLWFRPNWCCSVEPWRSPARFLSFWDRGSCRSSYQLQRKAWDYFPQRQVSTFRRWWSTACHWCSEGRCSRCHCRYELILLVRNFQLTLLSVGIGRPFLYAFSSYGQEGVEKALRILQVFSVILMRFSVLEFTNKHRTNLRWTCGFWERRPSKMLTQN